MKRSLLRFVYRTALKPIFFLNDPETVHDAFAKVGRTLGKYKITRGFTKWMFYYENPALSQEVFGIKFLNPVGLSAGFDKDANLIEILPKVGFGFMEVGSITLHPYEGNPKPRLYRLAKSKALIVYYGLKNIGVDKIIPKISSALNALTKRGEPAFPLVLSVAKTNSQDTCTVEEGIEDYYQCLKKIIESGVGDMYDINISCPNTYGGEPYTTGEKLEKLLSRLRELPINKPLLIKMPINVDWENFKEMVQVAIKYKVDGLIIGNLNKDHNSPALKESFPAKLKGGISGKVTWALSNQLISKTYAQYGNQIKIIGVGGIFSAADAYEKIKRGSSLVQLITGMIYEGPQLIGEINEGLVELLKKDGYSNIAEAVGQGGIIANE